MGIIGNFKLKNKVGFVSKTRPRVDKVLSIKDINTKTKGQVSVFLESAFDCWLGESSSPQTVSEPRNIRKNVRFVF